MPTGRSACRRGPPPIASLTRAARAAAPAPRGERPIALSPATDRISYTVRLSVRARTEAEARNVIERYHVRVTPRGEWVVLTAPGGPVISTVIVKAPRLDHLVVSTSDGAVEA